MRITQSRRNTLRRACGGLTLALVLAGTALTELTSTTLQPTDVKNGAEFGTTMAADGDRIAVGAHREPRAFDGLDRPGAVHVLVRNGDAWSVEQRLTEPDVGHYDEYGSSVALNGDTLLVGARGVDTANGTNAGQAYVYTRTGSTWSLQQVLTPETPVAHDLFGSAVALDGDTAVVTRKAPAARPFGSAVVFSRNAGVWTQTQDLLSDDPGGDDSFGASVALEGDVLAVGANLADVGPTTSAGAVYVFSPNPANGDAWELPQTLTAEAPMTHEHFGSAIALDGDTLLVGAHWGLRGAVQSGRVEAFVRQPAGGWTREGELLSPTPTLNDQFGASLDVVGDVAVVGGPGQFDGRAEVFGRADGTWRPVGSLTNEYDPGASDRFGASVAILDSLVFAGAPDESLGEVSSGAAYLFDDLMTPTAPRKIHGYFLPKKITYDRADAVLRVTGTLGTGSIVPQLELGGLLEINGAEADVAPFVQTKPGKPWVSENEGVSFTIKENKTGSSKASFQLTVRGGPAEGLDPNGVCALGLRIGAHVPECATRLAGGTFKLGKQPGTLVGGAIVLDKVKAKFKGGDGKDSFSFVARMPIGATPPAAPEDVRINFMEPEPPFQDDAFEQTVAADRFVRKGDRWIFKDNRAAGLTNVTLDYRKGTITVKAKRTTIIEGTIGGGRFPIPISVSIGTRLSGSIVVLAAIKGKKATY